MKYSRFEDVPVWQDAAELSVAIFAMTENRCLAGKGDVANQIQRAGLSVSNNIAEGFERGTTQELITFLYYARGSAGEVRSILAVMSRMPALANLKSQIADLRSRVESISRQLRGWADSLQNTDIKGQRYLTDKSRAGYEQDKRAGAFLAHVRKMNEQASEQRRAARGQCRAGTAEDDSAGGPS